MTAIIFLNVKRTRTPGLKMAAEKIQHKNCLQSTEENNKHVICRPRSVRIGKNCALRLGYGARPQAEGCTQDLWHSFSPYGPPGRQITYICNIWGLKVDFPFEYKVPCVSTKHEPLPLWTPFLPHYIF